MMKRFEGRSLAHPGCLVGVTAGLIIGMVLGFVLASVYNVSLHVLLWMWLGLTVALALIGWFTGERLSKKFRFPKFVEGEDSSEQSITPPTH